MPRSSMVTSSRRAGRVTNKTKLLIYRGSDKVDLGSAEVIVWENQQNSDGTTSAEGTKHQHVGAKGVESGELLVSTKRAFRGCIHRGGLWLGQGRFGRLKEEARWEGLFGFGRTCRVGRMGSFHPFLTRLQAFQPSTNGWILMVRVWSGQSARCMRWIGWIHGSGRLGRG
jgi:hypothetical protein